MGISPQHNYALNLAFTVDTKGGDVLVHFHGSLSAGNHIVYMDVEVDGARIAGDDGIAREFLATSGKMISFSRLITNLSAGSHTFKLQWKAGSGTIKLYAGAGTSTFDVHPQFWVREVS